MNDHCTATESERTLNSHPSPLTRWFVERSPLYLLAAMLILCPIIIALQPESGPLAILFLLSLLTLAAWVCGGALWGRLPLQRAGWFVPLLGLYTLWTFFTLLSGANRFSGGKLWSMYALWTLLAFLIIHLCDTNSRQRFLWCCILSTGVTIILYALFHRVFILPGFSRWLTEQPEHFLSITGLDARLQEALVARAGTPQAIGTFLTGNQLASYILLVLFPLAAVARVQVLRLVRTGLKATTIRDTAGTVALVAAVGAAATALLLSGSKGGLLAALAAVAVGGLVSGRRWIRRHWRWTLPVALAVMVLLGMGLAATSFPGQRALKASLDVRLGYWEVSRSMMVRRPLTGTGPGSWGDHYAMLKAPGHEETQLPHNFYILVLSESGIIGLLLFACAVAAGLAWIVFNLPSANARAHDRQDARDNEPSWSAGYAIAGLCFLFDYLFTENLRPGEVASPALLQAAPWLPHALCFAVWAAAFRLVSRVMTGSSSGDRRALVVATLVGLIAFLIHIGAEFSMTVPAISLTFIALVCLAGMDGCALPLQRFPRRLALAASALMFALFFFWTGHITPGALNYYFGQRMQVSARTTILRARDDQQRLAQQKILIDRCRRLAGQPPLFDPRPGIAPTGWTIGRWDDRLWAELAWMQFDLSRRGLQLEYNGATPNGRDLSDLLMEEAESAARSALALNPLDARHHRVMAGILYESGRVPESLEHFRIIAEQLHPSVPISWYEYARTAEELEGLSERVCMIYRQAASLNLPGRQFHQRNHLTVEQTRRVLNSVRACRRRHR